MKPPPLLPDETLLRVLRLANADGLSVMLVAGLLALASAAGGDSQGMVIGLLAAAAGAIELHGAGLLRAGDARGTNWLISSQSYLLTLLMGYCAFHLLRVDPEYLRLMKTAAQDLYGDNYPFLIHSSGLSETQYYQLGYRLLFFALAAGTLIYQGGMILYYVRRREILAVAVEQDEEDV